MVQITIPRKTSSKSTVLKKDAAEDISALKLVTATDLDNVEISDNDTFKNSKTIGLALTAANTGESLKILSFGEIKDAFFNFPLNDALFLGAAGAVTNVEPAGNFSTTIGHSLGNGAIFIDIQEPIKLC